MTRDRIIEINRLGINNPEAFGSFYTPVLQIAFDLGQQGIDLSQQPSVSGRRYGTIPTSGLSYNFADQRSERGLSLAAIYGHEDVGSVIWFAERKIVDVDGLLLPYTGSDGEPLILPYAVEDMD